MRFAAILACASLSAATAVSPLIKRLETDPQICEDNCRGSFKANGGADCGDVDECITNCQGCYDEGKDFTYGTCGCIEKGGCDDYCKNECLKSCSAFDGRGFGTSVCQIQCGPSCNCD